MNAARVAIFMGAPGAGKGTQAVRVSKHIELAHISTGDLFRENISKGTELGERAKGFMDAGQLVPDELVLDMLFDRVQQPDCESGYILDGFPRTVVQAEALTERLGDASVHVVDISVPDNVIVDRIAGRLLCKACGNIQHREFDPPAKEGTCDNCGGELYQRADDSPDTVKDRLAVYHDQTAPLVDYYQSKGILARVDGMQSPDSVFQSLIQGLPEEWKRGDA